MKITLAGMYLWATPGRDNLRSKGNQGPKKIKYIKAIVVHNFLSIVTYEIRVGAWLILCHSFSTLCV